MPGLSKKLEVAANIAIIALAVALGTILVKRYFFAPSRTLPAARPTISPGTAIKLAGYDWSKSARSVVLVLSTECHFCTESAEFYQRLTRSRKDPNALRIVAVLPQSAEASRQYLEKLGVAADEIRQAPSSSLGATGTPTLILVDNKGTTIRSWPGKLPASGEAEVLSMINPVAMIPPQSLRFHENSPRSVRATSFALSGRDQTPTRSPTWFHLHLADFPLPNKGG